MSQSKTGSPSEQVRQVVLLAGAARFLPALQKRLGKDWQVQALSVEEVIAGQAEHAIAMVSPPLNAVNTLLTKLPNLRLFQSLAAGVEFLDFAACPQSITVCNTSTMDNAIAEYVICAMLMWQLRIVEEDREFRASRSFLPPFRFAGCTLGPAPCHGELCGKTVGIIGFGNIGVQVAKRARAFSMKVWAVASKPRHVAPDLLDWYGTTDMLHQMVEQCHFVVVCCAHNTRTEGLVSTDVLARMRKDAILINVARGPVVDEDALYDCLKTKRIRGAVLDVWWKYPSKYEPDVLPSKHPYHELDNLIMTPHASGWTSEQEERKVEQVAQNVEQAAETQPSFHFVCKPATTTKDLPPTTATGAELEMDVTALRGLKRPLEQTSGSS